MLSDDWSGRIVSTHAPDIMRDLARHFGESGPRLYPCEAESEIEAVERLCAQGIEDAAQRAGAAGVEQAERDEALGRSCWRPWAHWTAGSTAANT